jgi:hypothetical protein
MEGMEGTDGTKVGVLLRGGEDGNGGSGGGGGATTFPLLRLCIITALFNVAFCRSIANRCISMPKFKCV